MEMVKQQLEQKKKCLSCTIEIRKDCHKKGPQKSKSAKKKPKPKQKKTPQNQATCQIRNASQKPNKTSKHTHKQNQPAPPKNPSCEKGLMVLHLV